MSGRYTASVAERITWSTGFQLPGDQLVLGKLATFGNFMTGTGCRPSVDTLAARAGVTVRTVQRALRRLEVDGWIVATPRHNHPTIYDVCLDRLATHPTGAKVAIDLGCGKAATDNSGGDTGVTPNPAWGDTGVTRSQEDLISRRSEISIPDLISSQPTDAARRPTPTEGEGERETGESQTTRGAEPQQRSLPPMDVTPGTAPHPAWSEFLRDMEAARADAAAQKRPVKREAQS